MSKKSFDLRPKISVITVVYNGEAYLEKTVISVLEQTYPNIEYIIIDGGSTDGTLDIIKKYEEQIDFWVSEKDKGIYDAMNKGLQAATGEYINFLNADDIFYNNNVLHDIFIDTEAAERDIVYGDFCIVDRNDQPIRIIKAGILTKSAIKKGMIANHQSIFVRRSLAPLYDLTYKYKAEWNWLIDIIYNIKVPSTYYADIPIVYYKLGGFSQQGFHENFRERLQIMRQRFGWLHIIRSLPYLGRIYLGAFLRKLLNVDTLRKQSKRL